ncbi:MAG: hypothetical protein QXL01_06275 [Thermoplasmatales archaeon]
MLSERGFDRRQEGSVKHGIKAFCGKSGYALRRLMTCAVNSLVEYISFKPNLSEKTLQEMVEKLHLSDKQRKNFEYYKNSGGILYGFMYLATSGFHPILIKAAYLLELGMISRSDFDKMLEKYSEPGSRNSLHNACDRKEEVHQSFAACRDLVQLQTFGSVRSIVTSPILLAVSVVSIIFPDLISQTYKLIGLYNGIFEQVSHTFPQFMASSIIAGWACRFYLRKRLFAEASTRTDPSN